MIQLCVGAGLAPPGKGVYRTFARAPRPAGFLNRAVRCEWEHQLARTPATEAYVATLPSV